MTYTAEELAEWTRREALEVSHYMTDWELLDRMEVLEKLRDEAIREATRTGDYGYSQHLGASFSSLAYVMGCRHPERAVQVALDRWMEDELAGTSYTEALREAIRAFGRPGA